MSLVPFIAMSVCLLQNEPQVSVREQPNAEITVSGEEFSRAAREARLPSPMTDHQFDRFCDMLDLSAAQRAYAIVFRDQYSHKVDLLLGLHAPMLTRSYRNAKQQQSRGSPSEAWLVEYTAMMDWRDRYDDALSEADEAFLVQLTSFLSDAQRESIDRVRWHRQRDRTPAFRNDIHESLIDLAVLVEDLGLNEDDMLDVDLVLREYERVVTPLYVRRDRQFRENIIPFLAASVGLFSGQNAATSHELIQRRLELCEGFADCQKAIARANREHLPRVLAKMPPEPAAELETRYKIRSWIYVYPDEVDPKPLFGQALSVVKDPDQVQALQGSWLQYRTAYDKLCSQAQAINVQMEEDCASSCGSNGTRQGRSEILALMQRRIDMNRKFLETLSQALPGDAFAGVVHQIDVMKNRTDHAFPPMSSPLEHARR